MVIPKLKKLKESRDLLNVLLAVALVIGFIFLVSLSIYFIKEQYGSSCGCKVSVPFVISVLTSLGVFVGILTFYFLSRSFSKEKEKMFGDVESALRFLDKDEKTILSVLIDNGGQVAQNRLSRMSGIDPVRLHRRLSRLEEKKVLHKVSIGMTNNIVLEDDIKDLFIR